MLNSQPKKQTTDYRLPQTESFYTAGRPGARPSNSAGGDTGVGKKQISIGPTAPGESEAKGIDANDPNFAGSLETGNGTAGAGSPGAANVPVFSNQPTAQDRIVELLKNGSLANNPAYQELQQSHTRLTALKAMPTYTNKRGQVRDGMKDKDGRLQSGLKGLVQGLSDAFGPGSAPVRNEADLYARLAGGITRGVGGGIVPEWNEWADRDREIQKEMQKQEELAARLEFDSKLQNQEIGRLDKMADNERQLTQIQLKAESDAEKLKDTKRKNFYSRRKFFDPTKASDAEIKELAEFGETPFSVGHYDMTKADVKVINGKSFVFNPNTRSFEDSNLPSDPTKAIVEYEVLDRETGVKHKYATSAEKAASLRTQLLSAGMQIEAASERQASQQAFTASQNDQDRQLRKQLQDAQQQYGREETVRKAVDAWAKLYFREKSKMPTSELMKKYQDYVEQNLDAPAQQ